MDHGRFARTKVSFVDDAAADFFAETIRGELEGSIRIGNIKCQVDYLIAPGQHHSAVSVDKQNLLSADVYSGLGSASHPQPGSKAVEGSFLPNMVLIFSSLLKK